MSQWHQRYWAREEPLSWAHRALSALLAPAEWAYRAGVSGRAWAYERGLFRSRVAPIPTLCIGNLTVGGTGKTPVAAWFSARIRERGRSPAVVMRGYGGDEVMVHRMLNPEVPVHASPNRIAGVRRAARAGSDTAILDDAFQHRALRADERVVLIAAEDWREPARLLPRGPWRESPVALRRATLVVVTRKLASRGRADHVLERAARRAPGVPLAQAHLGLSGLTRYEHGKATLEPQIPLEGFSCALAVAGVARPETVFRQLEDAGVRIDECRAFPDHHRYSEEDIKDIGRAAREGPLVVTLKDAVKLRVALPPEVEMHIPLQTVTWESGAEEVERLLDRLLEGAQATRGRNT